MVSTIEAFENNGGTPTTPGTETNISNNVPVNIRYQRADNAIISLDDPNTIPPTGTSYSRWKSHFLKCLVAPDTFVNNVKIFTDGVGYGVGVSVVIGDETPTKNNSSDAGYDPADTVDDPLINHVGITTTSDIFSFTSGAPKSISISETANNITQVGDTTNYFIHQMEVINTATVGTLLAENYTIEYDEV